MPRPGLVKVHLDAGGAFQGAGHGVIDTLSAGQSHPKTTAAMDLRLGKQPQLGAWLGEGVGKT
ncbi:hypothetical protein STH12_02684 [Shewanella khirikhana]|uniref:Uncharacterized protein n=1 Tax=Shewanella khirikhana TaxID=1965282 RepID=A0ABN5TY75_9GAMM|nr:hypothetical protein STH12_02684 [Shewanella khirikhana]